MLDIGGLLLLIGALAGAIKGQTLPLWVPQGVALVTLALLVYQVAWKRSRFAPVTTAALWVSLIWIAAHLMVGAWGKGLLTETPTGILLFTTPLVAVAHYKVLLRFSPGIGKKLELTKTEITPFRDWWLSLKKAKVKKSQAPAIELIMFDLGEEINFQNK